MKNLTQEKIIIRKLLEDGYVSRNWCISQYISRLSGYMLILKKEGWKFEGKDVKTQYGTDYIYKLTDDKQPLKLEKYYVNGELVGTKIISE